MRRGTTRHPPKCRSVPHRARGIPSAFRCREPPDRRRPDSNRPDKRRARPPQEAALCAGSWSTFPYMDAPARTSGWSRSLVQWSLLRSPSRASLIGSKLARRARPINYRRARSPFPSQRCSGDLDFDLFRFGLLALWHMHREHAALELRVYFVEISIIGQSEAAHERAVAAFNAVIFPFLFFLLKLPFAGDGQHAVFDRDLYIFFFHLRQLGLDEIFLFIFGDVRQRRPFG